MKPDELHDLTKHTKEKHKADTVAESTCVNATRLAEEVPDDYDINQLMDKQNLHYWRVAMSRSRGLIDLRDWKRFPVMRGGYKQTVISGDQTAKARRSACEDGVRRVSNEMRM
jgi:hypothetical protein